MKKLLIRTASGTVYVLLMLFAIYGGRLLGWDSPEYPVKGNALFTIIFFVIAMLCVYEYVHNLKLSGKPVNAVMTFVTSVVTCLLTSPLYYMNGFLPMILILLIIPASVFAAQLWRTDDQPFAAIGYTLIPLFWIVMPIIFLSLLHLESPGYVMMLFIMIWVNDSFAYLTGMLLGRHKMWERHSPGKTWEGTVGGFVFCVASAAFVGPLFNTGIQSPWLWAAIAAVCSVVGTLGDLVESMFKRSCGVKDSGSIMPGHGGALDRFDSILLTTPFLFVISLFAGL